MAWGYDSGAVQRRDTIIDHPSSDIAVIRNPSYCESCVAEISSACGKPSFH